MTVEELLEACGLTTSKLLTSRTQDLKPLKELKEYLEMANLCDKTREIVDTLDNISRKNPDYINYLTCLREYKDILLVIQKVNDVGISSKKRKRDLTDEEVLESIKPDLELLNLKYN